MKDSKYPVELLELAEDELHYLLGEALSKGGSGDRLALDDSSEYVARAKVWLKENYSTIQKQFCGHPVVIALQAESNLNSKRVLLLLTIADLVAQANLGVAPFVIAALIIKHGIEEFCQARQT